MAVSTARASTRTLSHVLLAGLNPLSPPSSSSSSALSGAARQSPSNPALAPVPFTGWLASVGRELDTTAPIRLVPSALAAGAGHQLVAYRNYEGVERILALGRNEAGQLGVGFASQEGTRGLVEGFEGDGVLAARASVQASYLLVRDGGASPLLQPCESFTPNVHSTRLYSTGNLARGRLGHPALFPPAHALEAHEEPRQYSLPRAAAVPLPEGLGRIKQIEAGFEHLLILTAEDGEIYGTGCNTDGQLGLGAATSDVYQLTRLPLPGEVAKEGGVERISAGADTSALVTKSGTLWVWGNSEYAQGMHGDKIDQIASPLPVRPSFLPSNRRLVDYRCGGSFALALDDRGSVYSAGFGALGLGAGTLHSMVPQRVERLEGAGVSRIRAGWGHAAAVRDHATDSALYTWGLNTPHGRLGHGALPPSPTSPSSLDPSVPPAVAPHAHEPTEVRLPLRAVGLEDGADEGARWELGEVECGMESLWVELRVEEDVD
ncbi:putative Uvb-resistance protein uvr8 [Rhodotorula diobovata]|uniref:Putative Uvb-resistance protein uvr8 n=1 Tax=Rhodotorula diobovata TaxID=5288 RepID=A0A5C5G388_9BASI|nr:putative Uvb-resistance protein uvr8 [Rhodotorula diobovata]